MRASRPVSVLALVAFACGRRSHTELSASGPDTTNPDVAKSTGPATIVENTAPDPDIRQTPPANYDPRVSTWLEHPRPSEADAVAHDLWHHAANSSEVEWRVFLEHGEVRAVRFDRREAPTGEQPPFATTKPARGTVRYTRVDDGWLAGSNMGEFGAQLDWYSLDGKQTYEVSRAQVVEFFRMNGTLYAVEGLAHLGSSSGSVIRVERAGARKRWSARIVADLPFAPYAVAQRGDGAVLITLSDALVAFTPDHKLTKVFDTIAWFGLYPTSSVLVPDETRLYVGMRQFVLEIDLNTNAMRFLIPSKEFLHQLSREVRESIRRQHAD
jgi:hypothetical protein